MKFTFGASFALGLFTATIGWHPAQAQSAGFQGLGDLPGGAFFSEVSGVSADGKTVVGWSNSADASPDWHQAFKWSNGVMTALPDVSGGLFRSNAGTASTDGSIIVGDSADENGSQAVYWKSKGQIVSLGAIAWT